MRRSGFTTIEMIIVVVMIGVIAAIGFPRIRRALNKTNVRSARVFLSTAVATARASAVQRGCRAVVHISSGAGATVWVTACPRRNPGAGTVDTVGGVEQLASRYNVTLTPTRDSIQYDPRGLSMDNVSTTVRIQGNVATDRDSVLINTLGKVVRS
jgi:prepilin-type N-terminal cleavage/methylation domain-containing protein